MAINLLPRPDLPLPLLRALSDTSYSDSLEEHFSSLPEDFRGKFKHSFSVTTLPRAPRQRVLFARHSHRVYQDPLKMFYSMRGRIVHTVLEKYAEVGDIVETRLGTLVDVPEIGNVYIHGQGDRYVPSERTLQDWKDCSVWAVVRGVSHAFEAQLNILRWLWSLQGGDPIEKIQDVFMFKDWRPTDVGRFANYPKEPVLVADVPIWPLGVVEDYVKARSTLHIRADEATDENISFCSDEERWMGESVHKVYKLDPKTGERQKVAKHNAATWEEAEKWTSENAVDAKGKEIKYEIVERKGEPKFCAYCSISNFCGQFLSEQADNQSVNQEEETEQTPTL